MLPSIKQLREAAGGLDNLTDEEIISATYPAFQQYYNSMDSFAKAVGYEGAGRGMASSRISAGIDNYQAGLLGLGGAVSRAVGADGAAEWFDRRREANEQAAGYATQRARDLGAVDDWREVDGVGSGLNYLGGLAAQSLPYLGEAAVGGLAARGLATGARAALRGATTAEEVAAASRRLGAAQTAGAVGASYPSAVGDILSSQREAGGEDLGSALLGGVPYAALNAFGVEGLAARGFRPLAAGQGGLARRVATGAGVTALGEGIGEAGQEMTNQYFGRMAVDPSETLFSDEAQTRYLDSFVGGAALGGVFGGVGGIRRPRTVDQGQFDMTRRDEQQGDPLQLGFSPLAGTPVVFPDGSVALNSEQELQRRYNMAAPSDSIPNMDSGEGVAETQQLGNTPTKTAPTISQFDEVDQGLTDIGIPLASGRKTREKQRAFYQDAVATGIPLDSDLLTPYWTAVSQNRFGDKTKVLLQNAVVQSKKDAANVSQPSAPVGQPVGSSVGGSAAPVGGVGNRGSVPDVVQPSGGDAGNTQPAGGQAAPVANAGVQRVAPVGENTSILAGANPAAPRAGQQAAADPFQVGTLYDEDQNQLEIAKLTGQGGVAEAIEQEASGQRADAPAVTSEDAERIIGAHLAGSSTAERDRKVLDAWLATARTAGYRSKGKIKEALAKDFGIGTKRLEQIANIKKLVEAGRSLGYSEEQVYESLGIPMPSAQAGAVTTSEEDTEETGQVTAALRDAGITLEEGEDSGFGLDDSRYWQRESSSGNQEAEGFLRLAKQIEDIRAAIAELEQQGLTNVVGELETLAQKIQDEAAAAAAALEMSKPKVTPKREVSADLAAAKQKFKDVGRDVTRMEPEELRMLRGEAERFKNKELLAKIDAQLGAAPAAEETAAPAQEKPAAEPQTSTAMVPQDSGQKLWESLRERMPALVTYEELTDNERGYLTELADRTNGKPVIKNELGLQELMGRTSDMKFGKGKDNAKVTNPYTAKELLAEIKSFVRSDIPNRKLFVVDTVADLLNNPDRKVRAIGAALALEGAYGVAADGRAFLVADRIQKGRGRAKFMHEVGAHLGLERLLPKALYDKLTKQIVEWAKKDDGSIESELAQNAAERVMNAGTPKEDQRAEMLAYFIEEAMQAGIDPTADVKNSGPLRDWFRTLWAAFKIAVRKLGFKPESMEAVDVVNMAFGAARLEIAGTWHGTAAAFRNFRNKFIGSGEGATAYGWGTYLAERTGIAKGYWSQDVERKTRETEARGSYDGVQVGRHSEELNAAIIPVYKRMTEQGLGAAEAVQAEIRRLLRAIATREASLASAQRSNLPGAKNLAASLQMMREDLDTLKSLDPAKFDVQPASKVRPEGSLMRVDTAIDNERMFDYDKPVIKQSNFVANKLMELLDPVSDEIVERTNKDVEELTGKDLIGSGENDLGLLSQLIMDDAISLPMGQDAQFDEAVRQGKFHEAASHYLRANGMDGIKFFDAKSRGTATRAISYDGRNYNRDELREQVRKFRNTDNDKVMAFLVLSDVLRNGLAETRGALEKKVAEYEQMFVNSDKESAARYGVKFDEAQSRADAKERAKSTVYQAKQLEWLNANEGKFSVVENPRTRNLVIFDDKNIFRVGAETSADPQRMKFGKESSVPAAVKPQVEGLTKVLKVAKDAALNAIVFSEDLFKRAASMGIDAAMDMDRIYRERSALTGNIEREVTRIENLFNRIPAAFKGTGPRSANRLLYDMTREGKWGFAPKWRGGDAARVTIDAGMANRFKAMPKEAQEWVRSVLEHGDKMLKLKKDTLIDSTNSEYDALIADARKRGENDKATKLEKDKAASLRQFQRLFSVNEFKPYAPMRRFGNWVVSAKSQEYMDAVTAGDRAKVAELEKDPDHYHVSFAESYASALELQRELKAEGHFASVPDPREKEKSRLDMYGGLMSAFNQLRENIESELGGATDAAEIKALRAARETVIEMYLQSLAENSARKAEMRRRGVAGEIDMLRSFSTQGRADAHFLAASKFNPQTSQAVVKMRQQKNAPGNETEKSMAFNEVMARHEQSMKYEDGGWFDVANKASRVTSIWMLATSPMYYLQNLTQPFMLSLPFMAGRHDYTAAAGQLMRSYFQLGALLKSAKLGEGFDFTKVSNDKDEQAMVLKLVDRGRIDIGMDTELGRVKLEGDGMASKAVNRGDQILRSLSQKVEAINRVSTALAAYRLERKNGASPEAALEYADQVISQTHGDYTRINAPRAFNTPVGKVALQFRKFQLIQLTLLAKLVHNSFKGASAEERAAARKILTFTMAHTGVLAGVVGLPGFAAAAFVINKLADAFGDDDEPYNLENELRKMLGGGDLAQAVMRGAPNLVGTDLSGKLGMGNALSILPYTDFDASREGFNAIATGLTLGATGGLGARVFQALGDIKDGDYYRGLMGLAPKGVSDAMRAFVEANRGETNRKGDVLVSADEISNWESFAKAIGWPTSNVSERRFDRQVAYDNKEAFENKASKLKNEYSRAVRENDAEGRREAIEKWQRLQKSRREAGFQPQPLSALMKAPQQQRQRERNTAGGVQFNKQNRQFVMEQTQ